MYTIAQQVELIKRSNDFNSLLTSRQFLERINSFSTHALNFYNVKMILIFKKSN